VCPGQVTCKTLDVGLSRFFRIVVIAFFVVGYGYVV